jgi:GH25 family lysozyme M1 (1,4-beta-N-acetylmuramidase)
MTVATISRSRSLSATYVHNDDLAVALFGANVTPSATLIASALAHTPFEPDLSRPEPFLLDISKYQGTIRPDVMVAYEDGYVQAVIARGGQSWGYEDEAFVTSYNGLTALGMVVMAYWVLYGSQAVGPQVAKCVSVLEKVNYPKHLPVWIDFELHHNQTAATLNSKLKQMIDLLEEAGYRVGVYTGNWFLHAYCRPYPDWYAEVDWWLAHYQDPSLGYEAIFLPAKPDIIPWERVIIHQNSSWFDSYKLGGGFDGNPRIDGNRVLNMTHEEFRRWLRLPSNGVPEPPGDHGHPELSEEIDGLYDITALLENFARGNTRRITEIEHWIESFRENT